MPRDNQSNVFVKEEGAPLVSALQLQSTFHCTSLSKRIHYKVLLVRDFISSYTSECEKLWRQFTKLDFSESSEFRLHHFFLTVGGNKTAAK